MIYRCIGLDDPTNNNLKRHSEHFSIQKSSIVNN
jgi:hypothetical protein